MRLPAASYVPNFMNLGQIYLRQGTASTGKIITGSSDPQLVGMAAEGITDAAYQGGLPDVHAKEWIL